MPIVEVHPSVPQVSYTVKRKIGREKEERGEYVNEKEENKNSQGDIKKVMITQGCYPTQKSRDEIKSTRGIAFYLDHLSLPKCETSGSQGGFKLSQSDLLFQVVSRTLTITNNNCFQGLTPGKKHQPHITWPNYEYILFLLLHVNSRWGRIQAIMWLSYEEEIGVFQSHNLLLLRRMLLIYAFNK